MKLPIADAALVRKETSRLLKRHSRALFWVVLLHAIGAVAGLAGPWLLGQMIDQISSGTTAARINTSLVIIAVAVVVQAVINRYGQLLAVKVGENAFAELREEFMDRVISLPLSTVERAGTGDLVSRTTTDMDRAQFTVRFAIPRILVIIATIIITLVACIAAGPQLAPALLIGIPSLLLVLRWYFKRATPAYLNESANWAVINGTITETVEGGRTVDALGLGRRRRNKLLQDLSGVYKAEMETLRLRTVLFPTVDFSFLLPLFAVLIYGSYLVSTGDLTVGAVTTVALFTIQLQHPLGELIFWLDNTQVGLTSLARVFGVAAVEPDREVRAESVSEQTMIARGVRYAYRDGVDVLHGIDLDITPGERLAIVGPSGAGKSTFGRMLAGIHPPTGGSVQMGGVNMVDLPLAELRKQVALVTQEHHMFIGSVAENLLLAKPEAKPEELWAALDAVSARTWVEKLPQGIETEVGSGALVLTPAQAQQVALARLVLLDPHTLVLDEATSLLDPRAARDLESSLSALLEGRTVIAIAHRLYTAHDADRVAVMSQGEIIELGSHDELVELNGEYAALWHSWQQD